ncbi:cuticle protein 6-like, partial [Pollicipes pollicipes]|uniref:cuticle protein 6-like n=1 Tax=Pollicipes pollicipes TaxID=41117 RepID=UPI001885074B
MKVLVVVSAVLAVAAAQYLPYSGLGYSGHPYAAGYPNKFSIPYTTYTSAPYTINAAAPYTTYAAPAGVSSQHYSLSRSGEYSYGYSDGLSTKSESKNAYGGTVGSYSYVDANGLTQTVNYVADSAGFRDTADVKAAKAEFRKLYTEAAAAATVNYVADAAGFRVQGTNVPVAPAADLKASVYSLAGPAPVQDTADVKAAKAEFRKLYAKAAAAAAAAPDYRKKRSAPLPVSDT